MIKLLFLVIFGCFAEEWQTYRCVANIEVVSGAFTATTQSILTCKKKGDKTWLRTTQTLPEKGRYTSICKGNECITYFPEQGITERGKQENNSPLSNQLQTLLDFSQTISEEKCTETTLPTTSPLVATLRASKLARCHFQDKDISTDSIAFLSEEGFPIAKIKIISGIKVTSAWYALPLIISYQNSQNTVKVTTTFNAYRINEPVPDEAFELKNE